MLYVQHGYLTAKEHEDLKSRIERVKDLFDGEIQTAMLNAVAARLVEIGGNRLKGATVEYPGYISITIQRTDGTESEVSTGLANPTWTLHDGGASLDADDQKTADTHVSASARDVEMITRHILRALEEGKFYTPAAPRDPTQAIFDAVCAAMQPAEELGGPDGSEYVRLMNRVSEECSQRIFGWVLKQMKARAKK